MRSILVISGIFLIGVFVFAWTHVQQTQIQSTSTLLPTAVLHLGSATITAELATTPTERTRGLGGRTSLAEDAGMLFVFPSAQPQIFWMKDTLIPLDFVWIRDHRVVGITANVPTEPGATDADLKRYSSPGPVDHVLEVSAGWTALHNVHVNDPITY